MILGQAITYLLLLALTVLGYALLVVGASLLVGYQMPANNPILIGLVVFVVALVFSPLQAWLRGLVDRVFFRGRSAYRERLSEFSHALTEAGDITSIATAVQDVLAVTVRPDANYIFIQQADSGQFESITIAGEPNTDLQFEPSGALARAIGVQRQTIYLGPGRGAPAELNDDRAQLAVLAADIFVALATKNNLMGWLALGPRRTGEPYRKDDIQFLEAIADQASLAVERAQAVEALERRVNQLNVLSQVSQAVNFTIDFDDLLELVYAQTSRELDTTNFYIVLHDEGAGVLRHVFVVEKGERLNDREGETWPEAAGLESVVVNSGQPLRTSNYEEACLKNDVAALDRSHHAWLGVPLRAPERTLGALVVAAHTPERIFTQEEQQFLASIADQAAAAVHKAELYGQAEKRAQQLQTLNEIAQTLLGTLDLDRVLHLILDNAVELIDSEAGSLLLTDEESGDYIFRVTSGAGEELIDTRIPAGKGIVGAAATSGVSVVVDNTREDPRWFRDVDERSGFQTRAAMAAPLGIGARNVGVIEVINKNDGSIFTEDDKALLMAFGGQAVLAIENARLYTLTDQALAARVDELSQLQRLDRELNAGLDIDRVMSITLEQAMQLAGADSGLVGFVLEGGVQAVAAEGYPTETRKSLMSSLLALDEDTYRAAVEGEQSTVLKELDDETAVGLAMPEMHWQLTIPMRRENTTISMIILQSGAENPFSEEEVEFARRLADHAAIAVANALLYREVQDANLAKSEFVSFVSHELKTPMTSIKGYADLLAQGAVGPVTDMQSQFLDTIRTNVNRMATLVTDLADIAQIESGRMRLEPSQFSYRVVIEEVVRSTKAAVDDKQQTLNVESDPDLPDVWADYVRQVQILTNLVSNAHKYTPEEGQITIHVNRAVNEWDTEGAPEVLHIAVEDSGIGIGAEEQEGIFGKFFRSESRSVREVPGTGLGLNIVKNLVELQGGQAWFESELGVGSIFHVTLPLAEALLEAAEANGTTEEAARVEA